MLTSKAFPLNDEENKYLVYATDIDNCSTINKMQRLIFPNDYIVQIYTNTLIQDTEKRYYLAIRDSKRERLNSILGLNLNQLFNEKEVHDIIGIVMDRIDLPKRSQEDIDKDIISIPVEIIDGPKPVIRDIKIEVTVKKVKDN